MKDSRIRENNQKSTIHPDFESFMVFNDSPNSTGTAVLTSTLHLSSEFKDLIKSGNPYYKILLRKDMAQPVIKIPKGGYAVLLHSKYNVSGLLPTDQVTLRYKGLSEI